MKRSNCAVRHMTQERHDEPRAYKYTLQLWRATIPSRRSNGLQLQRPLDYPMRDANDARPLRIRLDVVVAVQGRKRKGWQQARCAAWPNHLDIAKLLACSDAHTAVSAGA